MLNPRPVTNPLVTNSPATLPVVKLAVISPSPLIMHPAHSTFRAPNRRIRFEFMIAKIDKQALASDPTKARVDGGAKPSLTNAAWRTPNEYVEPA